MKYFKTEILNKNFISNLSGQFFCEAISCFFKHMKSSQNRAQTLYNALLESGDVEKRFEKIIDECSNNNKKYKDPDFYPQKDIASCDREKLKECDWRYIEEQYPNLFENIAPESIIQGNLGDCYFVVALIYASHHKNLVRTLFHPKSSLKYGCVLVYFHYLGEKIPVIIDTQVAYQSKFSTNPLFSYPRTKDDSCWFVLVEKAFAKACGSYSSIVSGAASFAIHVLFDFYSTSFSKIEDIITVKSLAEEEKRKNSKNTNEKIYNILKDLKNKNAMIGTSIPDENIDQKIGLIPKHSYYVIDVGKSDDDLFIKLRNPWGRGEYKGGYCVGSQLWTEKLKHDLNYKDEDDGSFWMNLKNYFYYFKSISYSLPKLPNWKELSVCGEIKGYLDGRTPCVKTPNVGCIPQWSIKFSKKTIVRLTYDVAGPESYHGIYICKNHGRKVMILSNNDEILRSNTNSYVNGIEYTVEDFSEPFTFFLTRSEARKEPCYFRILIQSPDQNYVVTKFNDDYYNEKWHYASDSGTFSYDCDDWDPTKNKPLSTCRQWYVNFPDFKENDETELRFRIFKNISDSPLFFYIARINERISYSYTSIPCENYQIYEESEYEEYSIPINNKALTIDNYENNDLYHYVFTIYTGKINYISAFKFVVLCKRKFEFGVMPQPDPINHCGYTIQGVLHHNENDGKTPFSGGNVEKIRQWCLLFKKAPTTLFVEFKMNESFTEHLVFLEIREKLGQKITTFYNGTTHFDFTIEDQCIHDQTIWTINNVSQPYALVVTRRPPIDKDSEFIINIFGTEEFDMFNINGNQIGNKVNKFEPAAYYYYTRKKSDRNFPEIDFFEQPVNFSPKKTNLKGKINSKVNQNVSILKEDSDVFPNTNNEKKQYNKLINHDSDESSDSNPNINNNNNNSSSFNRMTKNITTSDIYYSNSEEEKNKIIDISDNEIKSSNSDNTKSISENDSIQNVSDNINNQDISDNVNIKSVSDNDSIQNTSDNDNDHNLSDINNNNNIFNKDSIKNSTNDNLKHKKQYDSNELLNKAKYHFKRHKKAFTEMQLIWNFNDDPSKEYVLAISLFDIIILKQKRNSKKFTKKFKECLINLSLISIQKNGIIKLKFRTNKKIKNQTVFFQTENAVSLINSLLDHIQRILSQKEIKKIIYENVRIPNSLMKNTSHSILFRFNSLLKIKKIEISNELRNKISQNIFSHKSSIILSKIKNIKKLFPIISSCIFINKYVDQIEISDCKHIIPLIIQNIEYFDNISHVIIKDNITDDLQKLVEHSKNINSITFQNTKINYFNFHQISSLLEENDIDSIGFDDSLDENSFQSFIHCPFFQQLKYFRISKLHNLDFSSNTAYFRNIFILSFKSCNLKIGDVLKTISTSKLNFLRELDLSGNIGTGFNNGQLALSNKLISLYVNDVEWDVNDLNLFMNSCSYSNLTTLSINNIKFINSDQFEKVANKRKGRVQNSFDYINYCWDSFFDKLPSKMNTIESLFWNSNKINEKFISFLSNTSTLTEISFCENQCTDLEFIKYLLLNSSIQKVNIQKITFSDTSQYFNCFKDFLANIGNMKSLNQLDLSHNKFNNDCLDILFESLNQSKIKFIAFDDSGITSFNELMMLYTQLQKIKEDPLNISYPIIDVHKLNAGQNQINDLNKCLSQLKKPLDNRRTIQFMVFPEDYFINWNNEFPQFITKKRVEKESCLMKNLQFEKIEDHNSESVSSSSELSTLSSKSYSGSSCC